MSVIQSSINKNEKKKKSYFYFCILLTAIVLLGATKKILQSPYGFTRGTPGLKSISALSFGKAGILFIGDSKSASVFAVDTKDAKNIAASKPVAISNIDQKIAAALGVQKENITITDLAVNSVSKKNIHIGSKQRRNTCPVEN